MSDLLKIRDVSNKYNITTRTLRFYEEKGLLTSIRSDNSTRRFYDEVSIRRLEQILLFRQSNLSIKDIQGIFKTSDSNDISLPPEKRIDKIDFEMTLTKDLLDMVVDLIHEIEKLNITDKGDINLFNKKVNAIKTQITGINLGQ